MTTNCINFNSSDLLRWLDHGAIFSSGPHELIIGWGKVTRQATPLDNPSICFYFPDFFLSIEDPWLQFEKQTYISPTELASLLINLSFDVATPLRWHPPSKEIFAQGFHELQQLFSTTPLEKAVPYVLSKSSERLTTAHRRQILLNILRRVQEAQVYAYGFWEDAQGILGATPELLFNYDPHKTPLLNTMALAGTVKSGLSPSAMLEDKKLLHEHQVVVDDIVARLQPLGQINVGQLQLLQLPHLTHLNTPINVELTGQACFPDFVKVLHPTPALGGFPRDLALKWLIEYDRLLPRGRFGAPAGFWDRRTDRQVCYVAIRNVLWDANELIIGAGCGVVAESNLDKEWEETQLKTKAITQGLNL
jgi:isochorismate synthase EntC